MAKAKAKDQVPAVTSDNVPATLALSREELESRYLPVMHVATDPYTEFDDDTEEEERAARPDRMLIPIIGIDHGTDKFEWPDDTKSAGFTARPIFTTQTRAWWDPQGPDDKRVPDCSSANCVEPVSGCAAPQAQSCIGCPKAARGSKREETGDDSTSEYAQACQKIRHVYLIVPGYAVPLHLRLTVSSRKAWANYIAECNLKVPTKYWHRAGFFTLTAKERGQESWSEVKIALDNSYDRTLDDVRFVAAFRREWKPILHSDAIRSDVGDQPLPVEDGDQSGAGQASDPEPYDKQF